MKTYSNDEIRAYAKKTVRAAEQQRFFVPFIGIMILAGLGCLIWMIKEKSEEFQPAELADTAFVTGAAFGILIMTLAVVGAFCAVKALSLNRGIEYQALKRLVALEKENWKFGKTKK
jgi:hypothetical protein